MPTSRRYVGPKDLDDKSLATYEDIKRIGGRWRKSTQQSLSSGLNNLTFQTQIENNGITVSGTGNLDFQVTVAGLYIATLDVRLTAIVAFYAMIGGATQSDSNDYNQMHADTSNVISLTTCRPMAVNDYFSFFVFVSGAQTTETGRHPQISIYRVGK